MEKNTDAQRDALRSLPSVESVLAASALADLRSRTRHDMLVRLAREELDSLRARVLHPPDAHPSVPTAEELAATVRDRIEASKPPLRRVINATGTIIHTNLGRSLLCETAVEAMRAAASSPVALEYDLDTCERGHRDRLVEASLRRLTDAEAATVVNNNAAAVMLALHVIAQGREVIVSRGELIEIGGSFRVPDVMRAAGARLREVGTTNRTHPRDYTDAISEQTALLLKVHPSNYRVEGFTSEVGLAELVEIGRAHGLPVMEDLGSGALIDLAGCGVPGEPVVRESVRVGADLVTFSGDKLLGGPQAGIIVGTQTLVDRLRRDPMLRALRVDKLTYAALAATLDVYERSPNPAADLPMLRFMARDVSELQALAERCVEKWGRALGGLAELCAEPSQSQVGSGAQPTTRLESVSVTIAPTEASAETVSKLLRAADVPVIARIEDGRVWIDVRAVSESDLPDLNAAVASMASSLSGHPYQAVSDLGGAP